MKDWLLWLYVKGENKLKDCRGEFGVSAILSIAIAIIVSAFVLIPGMRAFATSVLGSMNSWWKDNMAGSMFPTS